MSRFISIIMVWVVFASPTWAVELLKQSSTAQPLTFLMVDSTDHVTGKTGLTPTVKISKAGDGGNTPSGTVTQIDATNMPGWYMVAGNATDTNTLGPLILHATATGADPTDAKYEIVAFDPQDAVRMGQTAIPNVATGNAGALLVDGTGTAAISTSSGKVLLQATQTGVTIPTVTTVTNQLTAAQIATGVWQDANGTDFNTPSSIGKSLYTSGVAPGGTNGLLISGSNSGTTTLGALTVTGTTTMSDGLAISRSTSNASALTATGNGTGNGATFTSGSGATGDGVAMVAASTAGRGLLATGTDSGVRAVGGTTGSGIVALGGTTSGDGIAAAAVVGHGISANTTSQAAIFAESNGGAGFATIGGGDGAGMDLTAGGSGAGVVINAGDSSGNGITINTTSGHGMSINAQGANKHGLNIAGGTGGTSDGVKFIAGTGGVPIRGDITGNVTGNLSGTVGGFTTGALADLFDTNSGKAYSDAVAGSVVKEIADHATTPALTAAGIADAVLNEILSEHTTPGSLSKTISDTFAFLDGAPTFGDAMDDQGYTSARAAKIDKLPPTLLVSTTIATLASQTSFTLAAGPTGDDALNGALVIVTNLAGTQKTVGVVKDYVGGTTLRITLLTDPEIFSMAAGDKVDVIAGGPIPLWLGASP